MPHALVQRQEIGGQADGRIDTGFPAESRQPVQAARCQVVRLRDGLHCARLYHEPAARSLRHELFRSMPAALPTWVVVAQPLSCRELPNITPARSETCVAQDSNIMIPFRLGCGSDLRMCGCKPTMPSSKSLRYAAPASAAQGRRGSGWS